MKELIDALKCIQEDIIGIMLPVVITALVALITLIVNTYVKLSINNRTYNRQQHLVMKKIYPKLKNILLKLYLELASIENNSLYKSFLDAISDFVDFKKDESSYRNEHQNMVEDIDGFMSSIDSLFENIEKINELLNSVEIPSVPLFHLRLKRSIRKMLNNMQRVSFIISEYNSDGISGKILFDEIRLLDTNEGFILNKETINEYIEKTDKWMASY